MSKTMSESDRAAARLREGHVRDMRRAARAGIAGVRRMLRDAAEHKTLEELSAYYETDYKDDDVVLARSAFQWYAKKMCTNAVNNTNNVDLVTDFLVEATLIDPEDEEEEDEEEDVEKENAKTN